ncbi:hypothetical protein [uncultured Paludibaculum sp.]|uniref:hypothetical protein n=1 Tax=uncultured Paludibaculum sp. TaxID=1765020 RepID=UPI002AAC1322|nr:hypothetical protein [uncultured Paludibaculum sp.]
MSKIREIAVRVRGKVAELRTEFPSGDCVLVSVKNDAFNTVGGMPMEVPVENAARHLVEGTHRMATETEIKAFREQQKAARLDIRNRQPAKGSAYHLERKGCE